MSCALKSFNLLVPNTFILFNNIGTFVARALILSAILYCMCKKHGIFYVGLCVCEVFQVLVGFPTDLEEENVVSEVSLQGTPR